MDRSQPQHPLASCPPLSLGTLNKTDGCSIIVKPPPPRDGQGQGDAADASDDDSHPILACRRRSRSMWLHFPHLELLFLFWAFEGAVAAQVSALKDAECPRVFWLALAALVRVGGLALCWGRIAFSFFPDPLTQLRVSTILRCRGVVLWC